MIHIIYYIICFWVFLMVWRLMGYELPSETVSLCGFFVSLTSTTLTLFQIVRPTHKEKERAISVVPSSQSWHHPVRPTHIYFQSDYFKNIYCCEMLLTPQPNHSHIAYEKFWWHAQYSKVNMNYINTRSLSLTMHVIGHRIFGELSMCFFYMKYVGPIYIYYPRMSVLAMRIFNP